MSALQERDAAPSEELSVVMPAPDGPLITRGAVGPSCSSVRGFGTPATGNHGTMSDNTIEQGDETQAARDELEDEQFGKAYRDEQDERERVLADEEDAE